MTKGVAKTLPDDWAERLSFLSYPVKITEICECLDLSVHVVQRWRKQSVEFDRAVSEKIRTAVPFRDRPKDQPMTHDQIDDVVMALLGDVTPTIARDARDAIRQLRREKKAALSELNRLKTAQHYASSGRKMAAHANGSE